ncbi:MAG: GNAT family N-acetyltransferase [bacterium]|nr:GNAT family N-acetyltransferase [bacterium]
MSYLSVKSSWCQKFSVAIAIIIKDGLKKFFNKFCGFVLDKVYRQKQFIFFEFSLEQPSFSITPLEPINVKIANFDDKNKIESEIFPWLKDEQDYDKRYFSLLEQPGIRCFLAEKDGKLVHYSWVFDEAKNSPLMDTIFDRNKLREGDAYMGPVFTSPEARGVWIYPYVLTKIMIFLKESTDVKRLILFVYGKNPAAVNFFMRLGFRRLN